MGRYAREIVINATPQQVFDYVSQMTRHPEWAQHDLKVEQTSQGAAGAGSTYSSVAHQFGTQKETQTVTEYSPPSLFAFEAKGSLGTARHSFDIRSSGSGSSVTKSMELTRPSFMARVMTPMISRQTRSSLASDLERIKQHLES
ncbi:MAG TPA: SRPBCC family protein [Dehalococcoidia bacterium]|nr:SRPBCC family protein [Dehalococcoidia bacterium]